MRFISCSPQEVYDIAFKSDRMIYSREQFMEDISNSLFMFKIEVSEEIQGCVYVRDFGEYYTLDAYNINGKFKDAIKVGEIAIELTEKNYPIKPFVSFYPSMFRNIRFLLLALKFKAVDNYNHRGIEYSRWVREKQGV